MRPGVLKVVPGCSPGRSCLGRVQVLSCQCPLPLAHQHPGVMLRGHGAGATCAVCPCAHRKHQEEQTSCPPCGEEGRDGARVCAVTSPGLELSTTPWCDVEKAASFAVIWEVWVWSLPPRTTVVHEGHWKIVQLCWFSVNVSCAYQSSGSTPCCG